MIEIGGVKSKNDADFLESQVELVLTCPGLW